MRQMAQTISFQLEASLYPIPLFTTTSMIFLTITYQGTRLYSALWQKPAKWRQREWGNQSQHYPVPGNASFQSGMLSVVAFLQ